MDKFSTHELHSIKFVKILDETCVVEFSKYFKFMELGYINACYHDHRQIGKFTRVNALLHNTWRSYVIYRKILFNCLLIIKN